MPHYFEPAFDLGFVWCSLDGATLFSVTLCDMLAMLRDRRRERLASLCSCAWGSKPGTSSQIQTTRSGLLPASPGTPYKSRALHSRPHPPPSPPCPVASPPRALSRFECFVARYFVQGATTVWRTADTVAKKAAAAGARQQSLKEVSSRGRDESSGDGEDSDKASSLTLNPAAKE